MTRALIIGRCTGIYRSSIESSFYTCKTVNLLLLKHKTQQRTRYNGSVAFGEFSVKAQ